MPTIHFQSQATRHDFPISNELAGHLAAHRSSTDFRLEGRRRSHLFVPVIKQQFLDKVGRGDVPADTIIWDLEDGIPAASKQYARECIANLPRKPPLTEYGVRINGGDPAEVDKDIAVVSRYPFDSVTLPKGESAAEIARLMSAIGEEKSFAVTIESVRGLEAVDSIASVLRPGRDAIGFGIGDMSTDLGVARMSTCENPYFQQILGRIALAGKRHGLELIDSVSARFNDPENARKEAELSYRCYGYTGKKLINPKQLEAINTTFSPTRDEVAEHLATLESFLSPTSNTNARVVQTEYKGLPAFIASDRQVKRYLSQGYFTIEAAYDRSVAAE